MLKPSGKDPLVPIITAAVGAGAVACFFVSQGQDLITGLGVTLISTVAALVVDQIFFN
ncbi:MAG: hypothetical protein WCO45_04260 [Pseudanabaena sp. ELA607]|jgi:hypothetical protein